MAERLVSPGVFTRENDLSFLPQGIAQIGAAFVGPTLKGPAFRPVIVESQEDFNSLFGGTTPDFYTPYAVRNYLAESSRATVVRVLGLSGYDNATVKSLILSITGSGGTYPVGLIHPSQKGVTLPTGSIGASTPTNFALTLSGSSGQVTLSSMSIDPTSPNYWAKSLGTSPTTKYDGYAYVTFPEASAFISSSLVGSGSMVLTLATGQLMLSGSTYGTYRNARTPFLRSQLIGSTRYDLFQFFTLSDGDSSNTAVKVSVTAIRPNPAGTGYGTFGLIVRKFEDSDALTEVLEQFDSLTMDPLSPNYVARRVGTARPVIDSNGDAYLEGEFPNNSKYIYISMAEGAEDLPEEVLPYGFAPLATPVNASNVPAPSYVTTRYYTPAGATTPVANNRIYYGFDFSDETALSYLRATPSGSVDASLDTLTVGVFPSGSNELAAGGLDVGFDLNTTLAALDLVDISPSSATTIRKFSVPFQGGFDGQNPAVVRNTGAAITGDNTMGFDLSDSTKDGSKAYVQAINTIRNPDAWDINLLVTPGVVYSLHPYIAQQCMDICETRGDAFYIVDPDTLSSSITSVITSVEMLDTSYAAVYYPWVKILDSDSNKNVWVPPSVVMCGVYAFSDRVAAEWYAPAGLNRGGLDALQVRKRLSQEDRDDLYENRVNPIAQFPTQGIVAWGQKTLQQKSSALDRVNVRRLLIAVKKFIASSSRYLVFEQNVEATRQRFLSIVNPYLASVQERSGLYAFKVKMDDTNNTPDIIDRNILVGELWLQPTKTAEFIVLTFNVLPTGATFPS